MSGEYKQAVNAYVCDTQGRFLVQQRALCREVLPGVWDTHTGHIEPGEGPERALRRELWEELALEVGAEHVRSVREYVWDEAGYLLWLYFLVIDYRVDALFLQESEVRAVKQVDADGLLQMVASSRRPDSYKQLVAAEVHRLLENL